MTDLNILWHKRLRLWVKELGKYGRLIFNDHFSIVLVALLGFGSFFYREQLVRLQQMDQAIVKLPVVAVVVFVLTATFHIGRPILLTKNPDKSYLFAQGEKWQSYWLKGVGLGMILPTILLTMMILLLAPFIVLATSWEYHQIVLLIVQVILLKMISLLYTYLNIFDLAFNWRRFPFKWSVPVVLAYSFIVSAPFHIYLLSVLIMGSFIWMGFQWHKRSLHVMRFNDVLEQETLRESTFYKWVSIFADVPRLQPSIKRRAFLDKSVAWLSKQMPNRYSFLYLRVLFRNNAYSGIWLRIMIFIAVMILLMNQIYLAVGLGGIGYILTIVQLVPIIHLYDNHPFQRLYPEQNIQHAIAFQKPILWIFTLQTSVYIVALLASLGLTTKVLLILVIWLVVAAAIVYAYVPWWAKQHIK